MLMTIKPRTMLDSHIVVEVGDKDTIVTIAK